MGSGSAPSTPRSPPGSAAPPASRERDSSARGGFVGWREPKGKARLLVGNVRLNVQSDLPWSFHLRHSIAAWLQLAAPMAELSLVCQRWHHKPAITNHTWGLINIPFGPMTNCSHVRNNLSFSWLSQWSSHVMYLGPFDQTPIHKAIRRNVICMRNPGFSKTRSHTAKTKTSPHFHARCEPMCRLAFDLSQHQLKDESLVKAKKTTETHHTREHEDG